MPEGHTAMMPVKAWRARTQQAATVLRHAVWHDTAADARLITLEPTPLPRLCAQLASPPAESNPRDNRVPRGQSPTSDPR